MITTHLKKKSFKKWLALFPKAPLVFLELPSNPTARAQTWSNYNHYSTVKFLVGIAPQGAVTYISRGYPSLHLHHHYMLILVSVMVPNPPPVMNVVLPDPPLVMKVVLPDPPPVVISILPNPVPPTTSQVISILHILSQTWNNTGELTSMYCKCAMYAQWI